MQQAPNLNSKSESGRARIYRQLPKQRQSAALHVQQSYVQLHITQAGPRMLLVKLK